MRPGLVATPPGAGARRVPVRGPGRRHARPRFRRLACGGPLFAGHGVRPAGTHGEPDFRGAGADRAVAGRPNPGRAHGGGQGSAGVRLAARALRERRKGIRPFGRERLSLDRELPPRGPKTAAKGPRTVGRRAPVRSHRTPPTGDDRNESMSTMTGSERRFDREGAWRGTSGGGSTRNGYAPVAAHGIDSCKRSKGHAQWLPCRTPAPKPFRGGPPPSWIVCRTPPHDESAG